MGMNNSLFRWFSDRRLTVKVLGPTLLVLVVATVCLIRYVSQATRQNTIDDSVAAAKSTIEQYKILRAYYTTNVVAKVKKSTNLDVSFDHQQRDATIPLPATMIHELSEQFSRSAGGLQLRLYSQYPFPNRSDRVLDEFGRDSIAFLERHPDDPFVRVEKIDGAETVRIAIADRMAAQSCVDCHNEHAASPKTDWKLGDVRGVLEVSQPLDRQLAGNAQIVYNASLITIGSAATIFVLVGLVLRVVGARLRSTVRVMEAVATGDLSQQLRDDSRDEVGRMCVAVNCAVTALREAHEQERTRLEREQQLAAKEAAQEQERERGNLERQLAVEQARQQQLLAQRDELQAAELRARIDELLAIVNCVQAGDLTQEAPVESDDAVGQMALGLNFLFDEFRHNIADFAHQARTLNGVSDELSAISGEMGANAEETSVQANVVSAAAEQVSRNV